MRHHPRTPGGILAAAALIGAALAWQAAPAADSSVRDALAPGLLGLYPSDRFKLATGRCQDCAAPLNVEFTPRLSSNRSYLDRSSLAFFAGGEVKARGALTEERFVMRTLWPKRFALGAVTSPSPPAASGPPANGTTGW